MTLIPLIERILDEKVFRASTETGTSITLRERGANMRVRVVGLADPCTTIRMGGKRKLNHLTYLKSGSRRKICDFLLVLRRKGQDHAVFVELKKSLGSKGDPEEQLLRSRPLMDYLLSVCDIEEGRHVSRPTVSYVIIYERIRLDKSPIRPDLTGKIDEIEYKSINIKRFQGNELELSDLVRV